MENFGGQNAHSESLCFRFEVSFEFGVKYTDDI